MDTTTASSCCWPQQGTMTKVMAQRRVVFFMVLYNMKGVCGVDFLSDTHTIILDTKRHFCRLRICGSLAPKIMDIMLADHRFADSQIHNTHNWKSGTNVLCCNMHIASQYAFCERNMSVGGSVYQV